MQGIKRRVVYVTLFEGIAILLTSYGFSFLSGRDLGHSSILAVMCSTLAVLWNLVFNILFEAWEKRQAKRGRSVLRRVMHSIGFEGGLAVLLVPTIAWWMEVGLWQAFWLNFAVMLFFLIYNFVFAWAFDRVFGLPAAAA